MLALGIVVIVVIASAYCVLLFIDYLKNVGTRVEKRLEDSAQKRVIRRQEAEAARAQKEAKEEREKEYLQYEAEQARESERQRIENIKQEIRAMPRYAVWRQEILAKYGRRCMVCGSRENLEVDHYPLSLHALVSKYHIENRIRAYECTALWDMNNGAPLCRAHHEQTTSSRYRVARQQTAI